MADTPRHEVRLSRRAHRYYERLPADTASRVDRCLEALRRNPYGGGYIKPIHRSPGLYRYRVGDLRVIYEVDRQARIVTVLAILPRGVPSAPTLLAGVFDKVSIDPPRTASKLLTACCR
jgi:mRNA interferase RelE/StbE